MKDGQINPKSRIRVEQRIERMQGTQDYVGGQDFRYRRPAKARKFSEQTTVGNGNSAGMAFFVGLVLGLIGVIIIACTDKERIGPALAGAVIGGIVVIVIMSAAVGSADSYTSVATFQTCEVIDGKHLVNCR